MRNLEELRNMLLKDGYEGMHVVADFDRTLTYGMVDGVKTPSIISMLRDGNYLTADYSDKAHALFDKYHPIELDLSLSVDYRKAKMRDWWGKHNDLLLKSGLTKKDLESVVENGHVRLREGVKDFVYFLHSKNIPLVIFSASGCGDMIQMYFEKEKIDYENVYYVTNKFNWDENGRAVSVCEPVIHCLNKDETSLSGIPEIYDKIKDRKNVLLLGDGLGDLGMIEGFDYDNLVKVGFLNYDVEKLREEYKKNFDVVLEGDGDFCFVNELIGVNG